MPAEPELPLAGRLHRELESFVFGLGVRRSVEPRVYVGVPAGERLELASAPDPGFRADLVERGLEGLSDLDGACLWITRTGDLVVDDADLNWLAAARHGFARHGLIPAGCHVLTRYGWLDLVEGNVIRFHRIRRR